jgi:hypothetical protein
MNTHSTLPSVAALIDSNTAATQPSTIPPAPASGVFVIGRPATNPPPGLPCAEHWPGADATATLRPSQVLGVAGDEIDWLYENTDDETDPECIRARATIESWLGELSFEHQLTIALHHDATPWPEELRRSRRGDSPRTPGTPADQGHLHDRRALARVVDRAAQATEDPRSRGRRAARVGKDFVRLALRARSEGPSALGGHQGGPCAARLRR